MTTSASIVAGALPHPAAIAPAIAVHKLSFSYRRGADPVIAALTHEFAPAAVTAVTGRSGRGKSTLLYLLGLLLSPTGGSVLIDGHPVSALPDGARSALRAGRIGFVFQDAALDSTRTIIDNVLEGALYAGIPHARATARAAALLTGLGVSHRLDHKPGEISGGQAQRVALCRALVKNPQIILADEPTGNLDTDTADDVWALFAAYAAGGTTVIVATHDRRRAATADGHLEL